MQTGLLQFFSQQNISNVLEKISLLREFMFKIYQEPLDFSLANTSIIYNKFIEWNGSQSTDRKELLGIFNIL